MVATKATTVAEPRPAMAESLVPGQPEAIFVVGVARSGTTLMRKLLQTSDRIAIAHENHYVGHLMERRGARYFFRRAGNLADDDTIRKIADLLYGGEFERGSALRHVSIYWRWLVRRVPRDEFERRMMAAERTERGFMAELMRIYADFMGRPLMGEKTPAHLRYVDTLLEWFPDGRVVHMMRDPRAVYVSDRYRRRVKGRRPWSLLAKVPLLLESVLLIQTVITWRAAVKWHDDYRTRYAGRYLLVKFEDIVREPERTLPGIFRFLGVDLPDFTSVYVPQQHGMRSSGEGLDPGAADRWRERLQPFPKRFLETLLRRPMRRFGYAD